MTSNLPGTSTDKSTSSIQVAFYVKPSTSGRTNTSPRRERIPDKPKTSSLTLWNFMRNCVGKDLSQIPMPVNFNEPLSMLQRLTEELQNSNLLDKAASCSCPYEQLAYLAVFIISTYTSSVRTTKPFNPLLGETYEFDRTEDLGWKVICEQVSHHPPNAAQYCEGKDWVLWQDFVIASKFTGNEVQIIPQGEANIEFKKGNAYCWNKVTTIVHNYLIGTVWVDQQGEVKIVGSKKTEGITCNIRFIPYTGSPFRRIKGDYRKVEGVVLDTDGITKWIINGTWDDQIEIIPVLVNDGKNLIGASGRARVAWKHSPLPEGAESYYSFGKFTCQLNEPEENVAPTDSRFRPDLRLMENGHWDEANLVKSKLEEKQRAAARSLMELQHLAEHEGQIVEPYKPIWFKQVQRENGEVIYEFKGTYWKYKQKQDWSKCPDIYFLDE
ncbi:hypothetical protein HHI36_004243 [Cryptolaemus montrouzieri]|uniref:Oxysterol-binding protein n=1 Tax=Cryptolaemus montrouzieri TaxID=559131 RepID=A0ABD2NRB0_9CUCU